MAADPLAPSNGCVYRLGGFAGRLAAGLQGLATRMAKALNRALWRRGTLWADRYHARALTTPRAVRYALLYVLQNWKKHVPGGRGLEPRSSAGWFSGWRNALPTAPGSPVAVAGTWRARWGWRRHELIDVRASDAPRRERSRPPLSLDDDGLRGRHQRMIRVLRLPLDQCGRQLDGPRPTEPLPPACGTHGSDTMASSEAPELRGGRVRL